MATRHFPFKHPTFGTVRKPKSPNHWRVSVYYWWYEYLRRNVDYKRTCDTQGKSGKCVELYEHFGNVHEGDFRSWWSSGDRGAVLFANPPETSIRTLSLDELPTGKQLLEDKLFLEVPLTLPINHLVKSFRKIVARSHSGKRGQRRITQSRALYLPAGKIDVSFLEIALSVWDARTTEPKKPLWLIAQDVGIGGVNRIKATDTPATQTDKKNTLAATASRYYRKASRMIELTGMGRFPH